MTDFNWPSREEWAQRQRTAYIDDVPEASWELSLYANPEEVAAAIVALKKIWTDRGRRLKAVLLAGRPLIKQSGEGLRQYRDRWLAMNKSDQEIAQTAICIQDQRREINEVIKELRKGRVPWRLNGTGISTPPPPLDAIIARHDAATDAEIEKWKARIAAKPIDDAAWEHELEYRRRVERTSGRVVTTSKMPEEKST
jgi:hypothetical protein